MSRTIKLFAILFLSMFVFMEFAQAALIRSGGRASLSKVYEQKVYYIDNQYTNVAGITTEGYNNLSTFSSKAYINGDFNPISAFPNNEGCTRGYANQDYLDAQNDRDTYGYVTSIPEADKGLYSEYDADLDSYNRAIAFIQEVELNEPCIWQFEYGETISTEGLFQFVFLKNGLLDTDVNYDVSWAINGLDVGGSISLTNDSYASLILNEDIDLAPGDYNISVSVLVSSDLGKFYYETEAPSDGSADAVEIGYSQVCVDNPNYVIDTAYVDANKAAYTAANPTITDPWDIEQLIMLDYWANPNVSESVFCGHNSIVKDVYYGTDDYNVYYYNQARRFTSFSETLRILPSQSNPPIVSAPAPASLGIFLMSIGMLGLRRRIQLKVKR